MTTGYKLFFFDAERDHTYEEIKQIEQDRRDILKKVEYPFLRILFSWHGTCLRSLATDWLVWVTFAIFVVTRIQARLSDEEPAMAEELSNTDINVIGGFLSFFLVLFVNQTNTRFFDMYKLSKKCAGQCQDVAGLAKSMMPLQDGQRLVRYMNAAHISGYVGLSDTYRKHNLFDKFNGDHGLLNEKEMGRLKQYDMNAGSGTFKELVTWCQLEVSKARKSGVLDSFEADKLHHHVLELRAGMDGLCDHCDQPPHYFYVHFLVLLSALYLPIFALDNAYGCGWGERADWRNEALSGLIVFLQAIFVVGLRVLGQKMIDPYGDDYEDLSVITYISTTLENCSIILSADAPDVGEVASGRAMA